MPFPADNPRGINTRILKGKILTIIDNIPASEFGNIEFALQNASNETQVAFLSNSMIKEIKNIELPAYIFRHAKTSY